MFGRRRRGALEPQHERRPRAARHATHAIVVLFAGGEHQKHPAARDHDVAIREADLAPVELVAALLVVDRGVVVVVAVRVLALRPVPRPARLARAVRLRPARRSAPLPQTTQSPARGWPVRATVYCLVSTLWILQIRWRPLTSPTLLLLLRVLVMVMMNVSNW